MLISLTVALIVITVAFVFLYSFFKRNMKEAGKPVLYLSKAGIEVPIYGKKRRIEIPMIVLASLIACIATAIAISVLSKQSGIPSQSTPAVNSPSITPVESPTTVVTPVLVKPDNPNAQWIVWLDDLKPYSDYTGNFCMAKSCSIQDGLIIRMRNTTPRFL